MHGEEEVDFGNLSATSNSQWRPRKGSDLSMLRASKELLSSMSTGGGDGQAGSPVTCREGGWGGRAARDAME
jgi:hypothetical protein